MTLLDHLLGLSFHLFMVSLNAWFICVVAYLMLVDDVWYERARVAFRWTLAGSLSFGGLTVLFFAVRISGAIGRWASQ